MIQINKHHISTVYFDEIKRQYIKVFNPPKWYTIDGLRITLGLFDTPGVHSQRIFNALERLDIASPEVVEITDYQVVTKAVEAETLQSFRAKHGKDAFREEMISFFKKIHNAGLVHGDPRTRNFLCDGKKIIIIDTDSLNYMMFKFLPRQKLLYYLWLNNNQDYNFCYEIARCWPKRSFIQRVMDTIYTFRIALQKMSKIKRRKSKVREQNFCFHINTYLHSAHDKKHQL